MTEDDFRFFQSFLRERSGLNLSAEKLYLLETRSHRLLDELAIPSLAALAGRLRRGRDIDLERRLVEVMTTNETYFFRDGLPFERLRSHFLPAYLARRAATRRLAIWSAAASTGQEAYSIAMILHEMRDRLRGWAIELLGTDISQTVIARAREGLYSQFEVQRGLPIRQLLAHFTQEGASWRIAAPLRAMVTFRTQNLLRDFSRLGPFDAIFLRNLLIYLDAATRQELVMRIQERLAPDGILVLGASETMIGLDTELVTSRDMPGIYTRRANAAVLAAPAARVA